MIYYQINTRKQNTFIKWAVCHGILWSAYPKSPLQPLTKDSKQSRPEQVYSRFMTLLFRHYKTERTVQFYARQIFLTPKHFSRIIKAVSGKTAADWVDEMVLMAAKGMLKSSNLTAAQIADELHFANPSFFGRYFKKKTGQTPLQYRGK